MEKSIQKQLGGSSQREGDYLLPNLTAPKSGFIGIWGQRRQHYLKAQHEAIYTSLLLSGELDSHLSEIDIQAEAMFFQLVKQLSKQEGVTEQLKAEKQMEWVGQMNSIRNRAEEIILNEYIYY